MTTSLEKLIQASEMFDEGWQSSLYNLISNVSNRRDSVSSGCPNTEKRVENMTCSRVF